MSSSQVVTRIAESLRGFGGYLECTVCGHIEPLGSVEAKLSGGWPKHHGYTMSWITERMLKENTDE